MWTGLVFNLSLFLLPPPAATGIFVINRDHHYAYESSEANARAIVDRPGLVLAGAPTAYSRESAAARVEFSIQTMCRWKRGDLPDFGKMLVRFPDVAEALARDARRIADKAEAKGKRR